LGEVIVKQFATLPLVLCLTAGIVFAGAERSIAQGRLAVDGSLMTGVDARKDTLPSATWGGGFKIGVNWSRLSFGIEVDVPGVRDERNPVVGTIPLPNGITSIWRSRQTFRATMIAGVVGVHFRAGRVVTVALLAGAGIERRSSESNGYHDTIDASGVMIQHEILHSSITETWMQVPVGVDAAIAMGSHLSLVPQFRLYIDPLAGVDDGGGRGVQARLRLALRWRF
jgi:hypothetical protein